MKGEDQHLVRLFDGSSVRFQIPVYQRNYDWKFEHCQRFFDDLSDVIINTRESHFFGSIVAKVTRRGVYTIIDGQQRITTSFIFLLALVHQIRNKSIHTKKEQLADQIFESFLIDPWNDEQKIKLKLIKNDQAAF